MASSEQLEPVPLPSSATWAAIDVVLGQELHGGYQSRVFAARYRDKAVAVKVTDSRLADDAFHRRLDAVSALAAVDEAVVGPIELDAGVVTDAGGWLIVVYPFVVGNQPDLANEGDVRRMAIALASLHQSLSGIDSSDLPAVAALAGSGQRVGADGFGPAQLLHGDFSPKNVLFADNISEASVRVLDFDDCGVGPVEFEVGNTLYMALFDASTSAWSSETSAPSAGERYERFREWFVDSYRMASGRTVSDEVLDESIRLRVRALARWIERPETAPIGIRSATPEWRDVLQAFVRSQADR